MTKQLRPYQEKCHEASMAKYSDGIRKQLVVLFTGAGKTFLTIKLIEKYGFKRVLWLCFQEELVTQSAMAFIADKFDQPFYNHVKEVGFLDYVSNDDSLFAMNEFKMGCIKATIFKPNANVVMGSVQTVVRRLDKLPSDYFDCIICDEAHLFGSQTAVKTINHFNPKLLLGLTATPHRQDGMMMGDIFDEIVFNYGLDKGIKDGWAAELDAIRVKTSTSLDKVRTTAGELNQKDLSNEVNTLQRNQLIVQKWNEYAKGRQTIAFCVDIQHAIDLAEAFKMNGIRAEAVSSDEEMTPDRSGKIQAFKSGQIEVLTNVNILVAGFDHPDAGCAIMACPTKSLTKYLQAVGRVARLKSKEYVDKFKQQAIILDIVDSTNRHNLVNAWELDKEKDPEDRVFISQEKRDKLLEERMRRSVKITHNQEKDERVSLLKIPKVKISSSIRMRDPATEAQLKWIKDLGYDVVNEHYTKQMCVEIINALPATQAEINMLRALKYDISGRVITRGDVNAVMKEVEDRKKKRELAEKAKASKSNINNNLGF